MGSHSDRVNIYTNLAKNKKEKKTKNKGGQKDTINHLKWKYESNDGYFYSINTF